MRSVCTYTFVHLVRLHAKEFPPRRTYARIPRIPFLHLERIRARARADAPGGCDNLAIGSPAVDRGDNVIEIFCGCFIKLQMVRR